MKYLGSKNKIAKYILPIMLEYRNDRIWVEPFVGGANTIIAPISPVRLVRSRTPPFHGENTGSNPVLDTNLNVNNMTEQLISFETAKLAKEKGFKVYKPFGYITKFYHARTKTLLAYGRTGLVESKNLYYASTQSLLQKWLREKHKLYVIVLSYYDEEANQALWENRISSFEWGEFSDFTFYATYEEALETGLVEALNLISKDDE